MPVEEMRYKYVLKGETFYYTREELKNYLQDLNEKNNIDMTSSCLEIETDRLIKRLEYYDGDPFGYCAGGKVHSILHESLSQGKILTIS